MNLFNLTQGEIMYYGGIASIASLVLVTIFLIILFIKLKRKLYKKINEDF